MIINTIINTIIFQKKKKLFIEKDYFNIKDIKKNPYYLKYKKNCTYDVYLEAIKIDAKIIRYVNPKIKDYEKLCVEALKNNHFYAIKFLNPTMEDYNLWCMKAIEEDPKNIQYVNPHIKNYRELYIKALENNLNVIKYINPKIEDYNLWCIKAVEKNSKNLEYIPFEYQTYDMCLDAIKKMGIVIKFVNPEIQKYRELCIEAVNTDINSIQYIPKEYQTYDMCLKIVKGRERGILIQYINPEIEKYRELCIEAVNTDINSIQYIPKEYQTYDMCLKIVKERGPLFQYINPEIEKYKELCVIVIENDFWNFSKIPFKYQSYDICLKAVNKHPSTIVYVNPEIENYEELCIKAINNDNYYLFKINPLYIKNYGELCLNVIKINPYKLNLIKPEYQTYELCLEAVKIDYITAIHILNNDIIDKIYDYIRQTHNIYKNYTNNEIRNDIYMINEDREYEYYENFENM
jgi:hypothetical protein